MNLVGLGVVYGGGLVTESEFSVWEIPPTRRTLLAYTDGRNRDEDECDDDDYVSRFFVPIPYMYFITGHSRRAAGYGSRKNRYSEELVYGTFLGVYVRPSPMTPDDHALYALQTPNAASGIVCLGTSFDHSIPYRSELVVSQEMVAAYLESRFEGTGIYFPTKNGLTIRDFAEWAKFKSVHEMNICWDSMPEFLPNTKDSGRIRLRQETDRIDWEFMWANQI